MLSSSSEAMSTCVFIFLLVPALPAVLTSEVQVSVAHINKIAEMIQENLPKIEEEDEKQQIEKFYKNTLNYISSIKGTSLSMCSHEPPLTLHRHVGGCCVQRFCGARQRGLDCRMTSHTC